MTGCEDQRKDRYFKRVMQHKGEVYFDFCLVKENFDKI